jgi:hypothetical protein
MKSKMKRILPVILLITSICLCKAQTFTGTGANIPDDGTSIAFDIPVSGLPQTQTDTVQFGLEEVCIHLFHTWSADLSISLKSPDGTLIPLFSNIGGDNDGFTGTCLSGNTTNSIFEGTYPYTGVFRPFGDMGILNNGQNPNGTWQLVILDTYPFADTGNLFDWSITFGNQPCKPFPFGSSDLPIIKIFTNGVPIPNNPKIAAHMQVADNGLTQRNYVKQDTFAFDGPIGIELHGHSSVSFPKKSFTIEMRNDTGAQINFPLLGLPKGSDFVLTANFSDKTLMRNALSYHMARKTGEYASRTRFCEVILDNTYQGVYLLTEKIKRDNKRVDISKLSASDTTGVQETGGYILKIDWNDTPVWTSQFSQPASPTVFTTYQFVYPAYDEVLPQQSDYIKRYIDSFEVALASPGFQDPQTGWRHFGDERSFMDYLFINEMSRNVDGYRLSTYFSKYRDDKGGKIHMGPVWDYDLAWYNADYCDGFSTTGWAFNINYVCANAGVPFWWERLLQDSVFTQNMACRWKALRGNEFRLDHIFGAIDSMANVVQESQARNFTFWPILGTYIWPNPGQLPTTYPGEVQKMKSWIIERLFWLDAAFDAWMPAVNASFTSTPSSAFDWTFTPSGAGNLQYHWDFGDGSTSNENSPQHVYAGTGTYTVQLQASTPYGCTSITEQVLHLINTGTHNLTTGAMTIMPNPATDHVRIALAEIQEGPVTVKLYSTLGQLAMEQSFGGSTNQFDLILSGIPPGVYEMVVEGRKHRFISSIIRL